MENIENFLRVSRATVVQSTYHVSGTDPAVVEYWSKRLHTINCAVNRINVSVGLQSLSAELQQNAKQQLLIMQQETMDIYNKLQEQLGVLMQGTDASSSPYVAPTEFSGGRPRFVVTAGQLRRLLSFGFTKVKIAELLGIGRTTLWRRLKDLDIDRPYDNLSDEQLDDISARYRTDHPYTGERELLGHLRVSGIKMQRRRVRNSIHRIDPINTALRWCDPINRRPYSVPSPNSLWHIDGNMKLVRWGFVIHAAIDGFSRVIVYANVSTNNRAATVLSYFKKAEDKHGRPSRVRCDYGGENIRVAEYMLHERGLNRGSVLTGPSIRNQRIERVWRDCWRSVVKLYSRVFTHLEERDRIFDCSDSVCLACLHYVYIPRIQELLNEWVAAWNSHPIEGCGNMSPLQLRESGFLQRFGSNSSFIREVFEDPFIGEVTDEEYGVDHDENVLPEDENHSILDIPDIELTVPGLSAQQLRDRLSAVDPMQRDNNYGMSVYRRCLLLLRS